MYFCPGATHAPHHAPKEWIEKYKGKFDMGYEKYREIVFENQKKMGIMPQDAVLSPLNPYAEETSVDGKPWNPVDVVRPWDSLSDDEKALFCRMAEVYAGFLSHADHEIGRLLDYLEETGQLDNTIVVLVSDNGASGEGGPERLGQREQVLQRHPGHDGGEPQVPRPVWARPATYNHYPIGWAWAFNTPFKMWKRYNFEGGVADPMVVSWPKGIKARARFATSSPCHRHRAHDLRLLGDRTAGRGQGLTRRIPLEGTSFRYTFESGNAPTQKETGFFVDARLARHLAQGLEGGYGPSDHRWLGPLR